MIEQSLDAVRAAHEDIDIKEAHDQDAIGDRDRAVCAAREAGASVSDIAEACHLSEGQVRKIVAEHADLPESEF